MDGFKLCSSSCRPEPKAANGMGQWFSFLQAMSMMSVITNAALIAFTSNIIHAPSDPTSDFFAVTNGTTCGTKGATLHTRHGDNITRQTLVLRFLVFLCAEHFVFFLKLLVDYAIPDDPPAVATLQDRHDLIVKKNWLGLKLEDDGENVGDEEEEAINLTIHKNPNWTEKHQKLLHLKSARVVTDPTQFAGEADRVAVAVGAEEVKVEMTAVVKNPQF